MSKERFDIHQTITDRIVAAIETGAGTWVMQWHRGSAGSRSVNVASSNAYQRVNILAQASGYGSNAWSAYRQ